MQTRRQKGVRVFAAGLRLLVVLSLAGASVHAQVSTASILGTVTDSSGAAITEAVVQVKNLGTGVTISVNSDAQGRYNVPSLNIGDYEVTASKTGFQTVVRKGVTLTVGNPFVVDFSLPVGQAQQTVTV